MHVIDFCFFVCLFSVVLSPIHGHNYASLIHTEMKVERSVEFMHFDVQIYWFKWVHR